MRESAINKLEGETMKGNTDHRGTCAITQGEVCLDDVEMKKATDLK